MPRHHHVRLGLAVAVAVGLFGGLARYRATSPDGDGPSPAARAAPVSRAQNGTEPHAMVRDPRWATARDGGDGGADRVGDGRVEDGSATGETCVQDSDCPPTFGCLRSPSSSRKRCLPSECDADSDCLEGARCRTANLPHLGPAIRRCETVGTLKRGEDCSRGEDTCAAGLLCSFLVCGVPCQPDQPDAGCDESEVCLDSGQGDGAACYPLCTKTGCPEGLRCVVLSRAFSRCTKVKGTDCHEAPCPAGKECLSHFTPTEASFECASPCNPVFGPGCPPGDVCGGGIGAQSFCFRGCDPQALRPDCPAGLHCVPVSEDQRTFGCRARTKTEALAE